MKLNISGKITEYFINSQLTVLLMAATAILGYPARDVCGWSWQRT